LSLLGRTLRSRRRYADVRRSPFPRHTSAFDFVLGCRRSVSRPARLPDLVLYTTAERPQRSCLGCVNSDPCLAMCLLAQGAAWDGELRRRSSCGGARVRGAVACCFGWPSSSVRMARSGRTLQFLCARSRVPRPCARHGGRAQLWVSRRLHHADVSPFEAQLRRRRAPGVCGACGWATALPRGRSGKRVLRLQPSLSECGVRRWRDFNVHDARDEFLQLPLPRRRT